ncbi:MAG: acetoin utilization protein AcuC [Pseudomonadota bacterium]|nr:acetoin utilization protein AcuC [Pseudomonadota bacterium]
MTKPLAPLYIGAEIFARTAFPPPHPLAIPRAGAVEALCRALGWLDGHYVTSPVASRTELERYHDPAYIEALARADHEQRLDDAARARFQIGVAANPIFPGMFLRASTAVGGSMLAARLAWEGRIVFHPPGGTHHGGKARASGFCFLNDPVFAVREFLALGAARVAYVDFDAHHGDGVEDAFAYDPRVLTISIHERDLWPRTGALSDRRGGQARNLPVPRGLNDDEFAVLVEEAVAPLLARFAPDALVVLTGADALARDPLAHLALSNGALWRAVERVAALAPAAVALGGGGYNPWNVARGWSGLWARLAGFAIPEPLPLAAQAVLASLWSPRVREIDPAWLTTIADAPSGGAVRDEIWEIVAASVR